MRAFFVALFALASLIACSQPAAKLGASRAPVTVAETITIPLATGETYVAFPDLECDPITGELVLVYRAALNHSTGGSIYLRRSSDGGHAWTDPVMLPKVSGQDQRDPSISVLADGRWFVSRGEFSARWDLTTSPATSVQEQRVTLSIGATPSSTPYLPVTSNTFPPAPVPWWYSSDRTFRANSGGTKPADPTGEVPHRWMVSSDPFVATSGLVGLPVYGEHFWEADPPHVPVPIAIMWLDTASASPAGTIQPVTLPRPAQGTVYENGTDFSLWHWSEPTVARLQDGRLLMAARASKDPNNAGGLGPTTFAWSSTDGATWVDTKYYEAWGGYGWYGQAPALHVLADGRLLVGTRDVAWTHVWRRVGLRESSDNGATWSGATSLYDCTADDCGYPSFSTCGGQTYVAFYTTNGASIAISRLVTGLEPPPDAGVDADADDASLDASPDADDAETEAAVDDAESGADADDAEVATDAADEADAEADSAADDAGTDTLTCWCPCACN